MRKWFEWILCVKIQINSFQWTKLKFNDEQQFRISGKTKRFSCSRKWKNPQNWRQIHEIKNLFCMKRVKKTTNLNK